MGLSGILNETGFWCVTLPALSVVGFNAMGDCLLALPFVAGFWLFVVVMAAIYWLLVAPPFSTAAGGWVRATIVGLSMAIILSVPLTLWPLRVTFLLSRPALDRLADRVERREKIAFPVRAGVLTIQQASMDELGGYGGPRSSPRLWLQDSPFDDSGSLVRGPYQNGRNADYILSGISDNWFHVCQD
jgi:hypothetical protein